MYYEKKYKEALERAKNLHKDAIDMEENFRAKQCEIIFPELKESEDERIRKALIRFHKSSIDIDVIKGYDREMANDLFAFMDSLPNESVSVWHDMSEEAENGRNIIIIDPKNFYGAVLRKGGSQLKNHNKERYVKWAYIEDIVNITNKEEPVSEDLEEAATKYAQDKYLPVQTAQSFKAGAQWQKKQTINKAGKETCIIKNSNYDRI